MAGFLSDQVERHQAQSLPVKQTATASAAASPAFAVMFMSSAMTAKDRRGFGVFHAQCAVCVVSHGV
jgi:hypothetical protein